MPECLFAHLATLVGGGIATGRPYIERHFMAAAKVSYSSICLIFQVKGLCVERSLCVKGGTTQNERDGKGPLPQPLSSSQA